MAAISEKTGETIAGLVFLGLCVLLYGFFNGWFISPEPPVISIDNGTRDGKVIEVEKPDKYLYIRVKPDKAIIEKAHLSVTFGILYLGDEESCGQGCWKISSDKISVNSTYDIKAINTAGQDVVQVKILPKKADTTTTQHDWEQVIAHTLCKQYAEAYFYPNKVKVHSILGVIYDDWTTSGDWEYIVETTVTNAAGSSLKYKVDCITGNFSGGFSGEVLSFNATLK